MDCWAGVGRRLGGMAKLELEGGIWDSVKVRRVEISQSAWAQPRAAAMVRPAFMDARVGTQRLLSSGKVNWEVSKDWSSAAMGVKGA